MNREGALEALQSRFSRERLRGAQYFVENDPGSDVDFLAKVHSSETDAYVRRRLELAINRHVHPQTEEPVDADQAEELPDGTSHEDFARAVEWVGGVFTHEIEGPIGRVAYRASREIPNYDESKTKREIDYLKGVFGGISQLVVASRAPRPEQFDLAALLDEVVDSEVPTLSSEVTRYGPRPFIVTSDRALLRLALVNGVKNAVEAVVSIQAIDVHAITVTWGQTDRDIWVCVIDHGPGLSGLPSAAFRIGTSTKLGHSGFGLAIAERAMESMGGSVTLQPGTGGGAIYEIRWERK